MSRRKSGTNKGDEAWGSRHEETAVSMDQNSIAQIARAFKFDPFDEENDQWSYYVNRFEVEVKRYCLGGKLKDEVWAILFVSSVGSGPFKVLVDHFRPRDISSVAYDELKEVLNGYYIQDTCIFAERREFASRIRQTGETVARFINGLRKLAGTCEFQSSLEERLRDQVVLGINNAKWQEELIRLHPNNDATFKQVEATALQLERAQAQHARLKKLEEVYDDEVNRHINDNPRITRINSRTQKAGGETVRNNTPRKLNKDNCYKCGFERHTEGTKCPAEGKECRACGQTGHYARVCFKKGRAVITRDKRGARHLRRESDEECSNSECMSDTNGVNTVGSRVMVSVRINGRNCEMLYDSGASQTVIGKRLWKWIGAPELQPQCGCPINVQQDSPAVE